MGDDRAVHPRVCGEHLPFRSLFRLQDGSSPRVRGTSLQVDEQVATLRFIPACAGNIACNKPKPRNNAVHPACAGNIARALPLAALPAVHPRVCGEHLMLDFRESSSCGSSPRVRGTYRRPGGHRQQDRFIPACAGNIGGPERSTG